MNLNKKLGTGVPIAPGLTTNIDAPESIPRTQTMHAYRDLFCRRCYIYNCMLHRIYTFHKRNTETLCG